MEGDADIIMDEMQNATISIHALRVEGDLTFLCKRALTKSSFLSTPSGWRATLLPVARENAFDISIHALRVEGDDNLISLCEACHNISIHALRVEGDTATVFRINK